jgi:hypothetical protein
LGYAPCQVAHPNFAGGLLAEKETREEINDGAKDQAAGHPYNGAHLRAMTKVDTNSPEATKRGYENTEDPSAEDANARPPVHVAVKIRIVARQVAMLEQFPGHETHHQEQEPDGRNTQKYCKR